VAELTGIASGMVFSVSYTRCSLSNRTDSVGKVDGNLCFQLRSESLFNGEQKC
jgi:hypothetical protein